LVHGYVDNYFIVNDPRGNATTNYIDRYGKNMLYEIDKLDKWISDSGSTLIMRILDRSL